MLFILANNYCHLSYEERVNLENGLNKRKNVNQIAKELGRCYSTILREIERIKVFSKAKNWSLHPHYDPINQHKYDNCIKLEKTPYVCNGCPSRSGCRKSRYTYYAKRADEIYEELISECRKGISLTEEEVYNINKVITPLIKKGQTINHLYINHPDILDFSKSSFYNYISEGIFKFKPIDLPRMVKYKKRKNIKRTIIN